MNVLIVHAHHEPHSFCSALSARAADALHHAGHQVVVSDLHAMAFDPVSDRRNFTTTKNAAYLKQQQEEMHASEVAGFAPDVEAEIAKLEACDAVIFSFPLWWFGMPAILKGWCDRVLAMGRVYGGPKLYEGGLGGATKRGLIIMTTGGGPSMYDGWGLNPSIDRVVEPVQHGIFWFNGFMPLEPFICWSPARMSDEERGAELERVASKAADLFNEPALNLPPIADFPNWQHDVKQRFMVTVRLARKPDEQFHAFVTDERAMLREWKRKGLLLDFTAASSDDPDWRAFLIMRTADRDEVTHHLQQLPLVSYLEFDITQIAPTAV